MITQLFFLIVTLLAVDLAPKIPFSALHLGINGAALLLFFPFLWLQKKWVKGKTRELLCQTELLLLALFLFYGTGFKAFSIAGEISFILFYFIALGFGHSWHTVRFLLPFTFPFILLMLASQILIPLYGETVFLVCAALLLATVLLFTPLALQFAWGCRPIQDSEIKERLEAICRRMKFRHGGMLVWNIIRNSPTAAIIGILPRFRYILFTEPLLNTFPPEEIEAVLSHEMGHAKNSHMIIYPFLFLGLPMIGYLLYPYLVHFNPFIIFLIYSSIVVAYIRFILGFFSRNFEKQADLYVFSAGLKSEALTAAFRRLATLNLLPLKKRTWHHGSLQERILLIEKATENPKWIRWHTIKIRCYLLGYSTLLVIGYLYA